MRLSLEEVRDYGRSKRSRGVHRAACQRTDAENPARHREPDREAANLGTARVHRRPKHHEHEEECGDCLEPDCLDHADIGRDRLSAESRDGDELRGIERLERVRGDNRAGDLGDPIDDGHHRLDAARHEKAGGHGGVQMSRDSHRRTDEDREDQSVRDRDVHHSGLLRQQRTRDDRATTDEHERKNPDELSGEMAPGVFHVEVGWRESSTSINPSAAILTRH
jgi:hypothetical protein